MSIVLLPSGSYSLFFFFFAVVCMWVSMYISFLFLHFLRFAFFFFLSSPFFIFTYTSASHTARKKLFHFYVKKYGTLLHIDVSLTHGKYGVLKPLFFFSTVAFFFFCLFPITIFRFCTLYLFLFYSGFSNTLC